MNDRLEFISNSKLVVLDCNVPKASIELLAHRLTVPIFVDPVSTVKVSRISNVLDKIDTLKPNEHEVEVLTGIRIINDATAKQAAIMLNRKGVKNIIISMGAKVIFCSRSGEVKVVKPLAKKIISTNGAGDCTMAAIVWARFLYGEALSLEEKGLIAQAAASITLESNCAVSEDLNVKNVISRAKNKF